MVPGVGGSLRFRCRSGRLPLIARSEFTLAARIISISSDDKSSIGTASKKSSSSTYDPFVGAAVVLAAMAAMVGIPYAG